MVKKRPCRICRRWFQPHRRVGDRQTVCSRDECQRERHRRACAAWRKRETQSVRFHRLTQRVTVPVEELPPETSAGSPPGPETRLRFDRVRDAVGLQVSMVIQVLAIVIRDYVRDAVRAQTKTVRTNARRLPP